MARETDPKKRVVITGMGLVSCFGNDYDKFYDKLLDGTSGVKMIDRFDTADFPTKFAAQITDFDNEGIVDKKNASARFRGVDVDLEGVCSVFELVGFRVRLPRQLAGLADRDEALAELAGQARAEEKAARLDAGDEIEFMGAGRFDQTVHGELQPLGA